MIQPLVIKGGLLILRIPLAFLIYNSCRKIVEYLSLPDILRSEKSDALRKLPLRHLLKPLIVGPGHGDIHVIVPGNKTVMAHGPQERPRIQDVFQLVFPADTVNFLQHDKTFAVYLGQVKCFISHHLPPLQVPLTLLPLQPQ